MIGMSIYSVQLFYTRGYLVRTSATTPRILFCVLLLLIVFGATGDYWSYRGWYDYGYENLHFEPIWENLRDLIPWGFDVFKLILWGGCLCLFTIMCRWSRSDLLVSFSLFALFYMSNYSYARATVAYMLLLFAYYLFVRVKEKNTCHRILMLSLIAICIWIGVQLHRSMPMLMAIMIAAMFLRPRKKTFTALLVLFPIISIVFNTILYPYILVNSSGDADVSRLREVYLFEDSRGLNAFIRQLILHLPMLLLFFVSFINILKKKVALGVVRDIAFLAFMIIYFAFIFYTIREGNGLVLFYRTINMAYPFMIMSIAYSIKYSNNIRNLTLVVVIYQVLFTFLVMFQILSNPDYLYNQVFERYF